jgi:hypothetical protein
MPKSGKPRLKPHGGEAKSTGDGQLSLFAPLDNLANDFIEMPET